MRLSLALFIALVFAAVPPCASAHGKGVETPHAGIRMTQVIHSEFGYGWLGRTMTCIAKRESHLRARAANWHDSNGGSFGLFQINGVWRHQGESTMHFARRMWNPIANVRLARQLYRTRGLEPWGGGC